MVPSDHSSILFAKSGDIQSKRDPPGQRCRGQADAGIWPPISTRVLCQPHSVWTRPLKSENHGNTGPQLCPFLNKKKKNPLNYVGLRP